MKYQLFSPTHKIAMQDIDYRTYPLDIIRQTDHSIHHMKDVNPKEVLEGTKNVHRIDFKWLYDINSDSKKIFSFRAYQSCIIYNIPCPDLLDRLINLHKIALKAATLEFYSATKGNSVSSLKFLLEAETIKGLMPELLEIAELLEMS